MSVDRHRLHRRCQRLSRDGADAAAWAQWRAELRASQARVALRRENMPRPEYPLTLPVSARRADIAEAIAAHQVVIIAGETGSGKTTQLPKICLEAGRGVCGLIGHTQPRRIAARTVAARIAEELQSPLGQLVGYKVRFSDRVSPGSAIKLMTDGILLAEMQADRFLGQYDTLIIDEAHERSLNIEFLLGYLKHLLPKRPDLKLIITSATIDTERFARHFDHAPVIEVSGRSYPVEVRYRPLQGDDEEDRDMRQAIVDGVDELARCGSGDVLVFLPGEREIRETAEALRKHHPPHTEILPLYAKLSAAEQNKVFQPHGGRRIVLATNVAETSLTVPGIRYVVDPGVARVSRYSPRAKVQRLPIEKISQASANQRAGRCGRVGPGVCIRLYSEEDFVNRLEFTEPEIKRSNLAAVILQMAALRLGDVRNFAFVEPPEQRLVNDGYKLLEELGAVNADRRLTPLGKRLARLPVDPRIGRMILAGEDERSLTEVLIIAAALSVPDPRERPLEAQQAADEKHNAFADEHSDFISLLNLWQRYHEQAHALSNNKLRQWCREQFVAYLRMREWRDIHNQLTILVKEIGLTLNAQPAQYDAIHCALLSGLLGNVAQRNENKGQDYVGARGIKLNVFPGSSQFKKKPKWIVAAELVETTRLYARTVARIEPQWLEHVAGALLKRSYYDAHWEKRSAAVVAYERATLYGLVVHAKQRVHYSRIDPTAARELFIRHALVEGDFRTDAQFFKHNRALIADIQELEAKARRRDVLVDDAVIFDFYNERIPSHINDGRSFARWLKTLAKAQPRYLFLEREMLMRQGASAVGDVQFPDEITVDGMRLPLSYRFEPGHEADGVTVTVPLAALNLLTPARFEWLAPGLLHEKICALLKSLPKALRRNFVPVPNFADACIRALSASDAPLTEALHNQLLKMTGVDTPADAWDVAKLPAHLLMNFSVVDEQGGVVGKGRDLQVLQQRLAERAQRSFTAQPVWDGEQAQVKTWNFGDLPETIEFQRSGVRMRGYPVIVDKKSSVAINVLDRPSPQQMRRGLCRLAMLQMPDKTKYLNKNLPQAQQIFLYYAPIGNSEAIKQDIVFAAVEQACFVNGDLPRTASAFAACVGRGRERLLEEANALCQLVVEVLAEHHRLAKRLKGALPAAWLHAMSDIKAQLEHLVFPGFVLHTPRPWLNEYPRYLAAVHLRLDKLAGAMQRDRRAMEELKPLWQAYLEHDATQGGRSDEASDWVEYRWQLEELRVSLFAQELKTRMPVSVKRLNALLRSMR